MEPLLSPKERQMVLRGLKRGPKFGDAEKLRQFALALAKKISGRDPREHYARHMTEWRAENGRG